MNSVERDEVLEVIRDVIAEYGCASIAACGDDEKYEAAIDEKEIGMTTIEDMLKKHDPTLERVIDKVTYKWVKKGTG